MEVKFPPDVEKYINDRVKTHGYASADELVTAAVLQMQDDERFISKEDREAIAEGEADIAAGRCQDFETFVKEFKKETGQE